MQSRLSRRLRQLDLTTFDEYYDLLTAELSRPGQLAQSELQQMINQITTNKTDFYREHHHFDLLASLLQRARAAHHGRMPPWKIWCTASSTGEEPYTIAFTVREALGEADAGRVEILASDIDTEILAKARAGVYAMDRVLSMTEERKRRFFLKGKGSMEGYVCVRPEIRRMCGLSG